MAEGKGKSRSAKEGTLRDMARLIDKKLAGQGLKRGTAAWDKAFKSETNKIGGLNSRLTDMPQSKNPVAKKTASTAKKASPAAKKTSEGLSRTRPVPKPGSVAKGAVGAAKIAGGVAAGAAGAAGAAKGAKAAKAAASGYRAGSAAAKSGRSTASLPSRYQIAAGRANTGRGAAGNFGYRMGSKGAQKYHGR